jgi:pimeloyl-ACP methyl ester carboxylesterase
MKKSRLAWWVIRYVGPLVPQRLRADWRQEWEAELHWREQQLAAWDKLTLKNKLDLWWHSAGAFLDALWLQPKRWEDEMMQDIRYGIQMLRKQPGFMLLARLTLSLGLGVTFGFPLAAQTAPDKERTPAPVRGVKVDVGGYKLQLFCSGQGKPTVVVEAGLGEPAVESGSWDQVVHTVAKTARICLYDRAGLGASDPPPAKPRTSQDIAKDLHHLLINAKEVGPFIFVGHSIGGFHLRVYADRYSQDVAAMVLVDSSHPDQWAKWLTALPPEAANEAESVKDTRKHLSSRINDPTQNPEQMDIGSSAAQVRTARPLGDKPLVILTHSPQWRMVPDLPDNILQRMEQISQELQTEFLRLSTNSTQIIAKEAGHYIQSDEPALVINAILKMRQEVRKGK